MPAPPDRSSWIDEAADYACSDAAFVVALVVLGGLLVALLICICSRPLLDVLQATLGHASVVTIGHYLHARPTDSRAPYLAV